MTSAKCKIVKIVSIFFSFEMEHSNETMNFYKITKVHRKKCTDLVALTDGTMFKQMNNLVMALM